MKYSVLFLAVYLLACAFGFSEDERLKGMSLQDLKTTETMIEESLKSETPVRLEISLGKDMDDREKSEFLRRMRLLPSLVVVEHSCDYRIDILISKISETLYVCSAFIEEKDVQINGDFGIAKGIVNRFKNSHSEFDAVATEKEFAGVADSYFPSGHLLCFGNSQDDVLARAVAQIDTYTIEPMRKASQNLRDVQTSNLVAIKAALRERDQLVTKSQK